MFNISLLRQFTRLSLNSAIKYQPISRNLSTSNALQFNITLPLCAEPMKKKKKVDPQIVKAREERRRKKLEKEIRKLKKNARQLKPIEELEVPLSVIDQLPTRRRPEVQLTPAQSEARALLQKQWCNYKRQEFMSHVSQIDRIMAAQKRALEQLYEESEDLYNAAVMPDPQLIPFSARGPVATPPVDQYHSPDGEYVDVSKKWVE